MADKIADGLRSEIEDVPIGDEKGDSHSLSLKGEAHDIDPVLEKKVIRKVDFNLVPILFLLFLCAFIDRYVFNLVLLCCYLLTHAFSLPESISAMLVSRAWKRI